MRIISRKKLLAFSEKYPDSYKALDAWFRLAKSANWQNLSDVRRFCNSADLAGRFTVFNIKGNHYRLIADIQYKRQTIFIKYVLTHKEYDKNEWKRDPYY